MIFHDEFSEVSMDLANQRNHTVKEAPLYVYVCICICTCMCMYTYVTVFTS